VVVKKFLLFILSIAFAGWFFVNAGGPFAFAATAPTITGWTTNSSTASGAILTITGTNLPALLGGYSWAGGQDFGNIQITELSPSVGGWGWGNGSSSDASLTVLSASSTQYVLQLEPFGVMDNNAIYQLDLSPIEVASSSDLTAYANFNFATGSLSLITSPVSSVAFSPSGTGTSGTLSWSVPSEPSGTTFSVSNNGSVIASGLTGSSYPVSGLSTGSSNSFTIQAMNGSYSASSSAISYTVPSVPSVPSGLTAVAGDKNISLSWLPVSGATSYSLNRNGTILAANLTSTSYVDGTASIGVSYNYTVVASNIAGTSAQSNAVSALMVQLDPPTAVQVHTTGTTVTITWSPGPNDPSGSIFTVFANGAKLGTTTSYSYTTTVGASDPYTIYTVTAVAPGNYATSPAGVSGQQLHSPFSPADILRNTINLLTSTNPYLLLILALFFAIKVVPFIINIFKPKKMRKKNNKHTSTKKLVSDSKKSNVTVTSTANLLSSPSNKPQNLLYSDKKESILAQLVKSRTSDAVLQSRLANFYEQSGLSKDYAYSAAAYSVKKWRVDRKVKDDFSVDFSNTLNRFKDKEISYTTRKGRSKGRNYDI